MEDKSSTGSSVAVKKVSLLLDCVSLLSRYFGQKEQVFFDFVFVLLSALIGDSKLQASPAPNLEY